MKRTFTWVLVAALLAATAPARAQTSDEDFQQRVDLALDHYNSRRYVEAAAAFEAAFELRNDPELLYNAARSLERGLQRDQAIAMYERFLALPGSTAELRNRATQSVQALRAEASGSTGQGATGSGSGTGSGSATGGPGPGTGGPSTGGAPDDRRGGGSDSTLQWVLVGAGGVLIGVGSVFGITALTANSDFNDATDPTEQQSLADDVDRNALLADVFIGTGAAAAVVGIIWLIAGAGGDEESEETAFAPVFLPSGGGFQLRSRF